MPAGAEILAIGTEILLGEIVDTNTQAIARALRDVGLDLFRTATVGDNAERIAQAVKDALQRAQVVITTGGLGPTVDDATREGIARAMGVDLEFRPELWGWILERFDRYGVKPTENNRRQAMLPAGAAAIQNPMGTAPAFRVEREGQVVISLPGVPAEMAYLLEAEVLPYLRKAFKLRGVIKARVVRVAGVGESWLDEHIGDLEQLSNPTVGLSAHPGRVDIRITAKAGTEMEAEEMIWAIQATLQQRLKDRIYGVDAETLESAVLGAVRAKGWRLVVAEAGTGGALGAALAATKAGKGGGSDAPPAPALGHGTFAGGRLLAGGTGREQLAEAAAAAQQETGAEVALQLLLETGAKQHALFVAMRSPSDEQSWERSYGGALPNAPYWAVSLALDYLRRQLAA